MDLATLHTEMQSVFHEFKTQHAARLAEEAKLGTATAETRAYAERLNSRLDEIERQYNELAAKAKRPRTASGDPEHGGSPERQVFLKALRYGRKPEALSADEMKMVKLVDIDAAKAMSLSDDALGGFLAPIEFANEIIKAVIPISPIRTIARVRQTADREVRVPRRSGTFAATWSTETATRSDATGLTFGSENLTPHEMTALSLVSVQSMEDSAFNLEQFLQEEFAEQFALAEGAAFVSGTGVGKPEGVTFNSTVTGAAVVTGHATDLKPDAIVAATYKLKAGYAPNATWILHRQTVGSIRQIKDGMGNYLWQPGLGTDNPATIMGRPYVECVDMAAPSTGVTFAANAYPMVLGDFRRGYYIVDRVQMVVQRLVEKYADSGQIGFLARKRVGGQVVLADAFVPVKCST